MNSFNRNRYSTTIKRLWQEYGRAHQNIPAQIGELPLLKELVECFKPSQPFRDRTALLIQHQCANHYAQAMALMELGIEPDRLFWIDIPYSSHQEVRERLVKRGVPRPNFANSGDYQTLQPFDPYMRSRVEKRVGSLLAHAPREALLVLDDGAYFLEALSGFKRQFQDVVVVEQTTRGLIKIEQSATLKDLADKIRVINVARSWPKKHLEPPFIGLDVCTSLRKKVDLHLRGRRKGPCLVLGYGSIGEQIAEFLFGCLNIGKNNIHVYDTDNKRLNIARKAGFSIWDRGDLQTKFRLVIGCSGKPSFSVGDRVYLEDGAVLASDAFFPFNDCVQLAHEAGIEAFVQPGGSIRDKDSIEYCKANNLAMVMTDMRHFKH